MKKKLYSFRADIDLLDSLREEADERRVTVTELMHELLYQGLKSLKKDAPTLGDNDTHIVQRIKEQVKDEIMAEIRKEMLEQP
ncbi:MAG: hypothetical protein F6K30_20750 [Cyanothece sp. SIO2G6]|nr:hypothetical protein [Cyanothece sp. SIO2G6]